MRDGIGHRIAAKPLVGALLSCLQLPVAGQRQIAEPTSEQAESIERTLLGIRERSDAPLELMQQLRQRVAEFPWSAAEIVLKARSDLGNLALLATHPREAIVQFRTVLERVSEPSADIRARALYGLAQAHRQLGEDATAARYYRRLLQEHEGTLYANYARTGLGQLHGSSPEGVRVGDAAPSFGKMLDTQQRAVALETLVAPKNRDPVLLLFWRPSHARSVALLSRLLEVWQRRRQPSDHCIAFALEVKRAEIDKVADFGDVRIVHCDREFADPVALTYGVDAVPTHFLIGPTGKVLARNPSPERLDSILENFR